MSLAAAAAAAAAAAVRRSRTLLRSLSTAAAPPDRKVISLSDLTQLYSPASSTESAAASPGDEELVDLSSRRFAGVSALFSPTFSLSSDADIAAILPLYASAFASLPNPKAVALNAVLSPFLRRGLRHRVPQLFTQLVDQFDITPDDKSYAILIRSYCMAKNFPKVFSVFKEMQGKCVSRSTKVYTTILEALYRAKEIDAAEEVWEWMVSDRCEPDAFAYVTRVVHHTVNGKPEEVLGVIKEMEAAGVKPDTIAYNYLINSYCKHRRMEEAKEVYKNLGKRGCEANSATFQHMLGHLCAAKQFDAALGVYKDSAKEKLLPEVKTIEALAKGLATFGHAEDAKWVIDEARKQYPESSLGGLKRVEKKYGLIENEMEPLENVA